jgi:hypothetical protein
VHVSCCAAGFTTPQDLLRQQQKGRRRQQQNGSLKPHAVLRQGSSANSSSSSNSRVLNSPSQSAGYQSGTESSRYRTNEPIPYSISMHTSVLQDSRSKRSAGTSRSDACGGRTFQLPLYKLAAFIRTAKLLPWLLDKYLVQLQLKGQEQRIASGGQRVDGLPVMPCLQLHLQQQVTWAAAGASNSGQRRR